MEKSKRMAKAATLLMALMILFIPFGSVFAAAPQVPLISNLQVVKNGTRNMMGSEGTYYVVEGDTHFLNGTITNVGSSFTLAVQVRNQDTDTYIRKATARITFNSKRDYFELRELSHDRRIKGGQYSSEQNALSEALRLDNLQPGYYSFSFAFSEWSSSWTTIYVRVLSSKVETFVRQAYAYMDLRYPSDYLKTAYKLQTKSISASDFLYYSLFSANWTKYTDMNRVNAIQMIYTAAMGTRCTSSKLNAYLNYSVRNGLVATVQTIIYSRDFSERCDKLGIKFY